jgi:cell fate (sporulation/competence/biofilm development) regulator YlbF (YheA/YmcA/DUF963 family)
VSTTQVTMDPPVREAVTAFAQVLADTPEFRAFEESYHGFKHNRVVQDAVRRFEEKQRSLQMMQQLGAVEPTERDELNRLREAMMNEPKVRAYVEAQDQLMLLCQSVVKEMSEAIGLDFAGACAPSCCG